MPLPPSYLEVIIWNEKPTSDYSRTTWEGSAVTIQGLGKI